MKLRTALHPTSPFVPDGISSVEEKNKYDIAAAERALREKRLPLTGSKLRRALGGLKQWYRDEMEMRQTEIQIRERNRDAYMRVRNSELGKRLAQENREVSADIEYSLRLVPSRVIENYPLPEERTNR